MNLNNKKMDLFQLSKQLEKEEQDKMYAIQVKKISNAYRKVQSLKISNPAIVSKDPKQQPKKSKPESTYAMKIKQTLKEINANKTKQMNIITKNNLNKQKIKDSKKQVSKLQQISLNKLFIGIQKYNQRMLQQSFAKMLDHYRSDILEQQKFIKKYQFFKIFRAWKEEIIYIKLQKQKQKDDRQNLFQKEELSKQFYNFLLIKKAYKIWRNQIKKQIKRKRYQKQLIKKQVQEQLKIEKPKTIIQNNEQLQNKMRGFLDNLKNKIQPKNNNKNNNKQIKQQNHNQRLITIKQKTQQSQGGTFKFKGKTQEQREQFNNYHNFQESSGDNYNNQQNVEGNNQNQLQKIETSEQYKKIKNSEDLQKMRRQLQNKYKTRKQTLQKLKKQKQSKKKQQQRQRAQLQRQIEVQQKRIKQQKYKQFLKNKQEMQQWQKKQKIIIQKADKFNKLRLQKYYGFYPLKSIKNIKKIKAEKIYQTLLLIIYRIKSVTFIQNLHDNNQRIVEDLYQKMGKRWRLNKLKNIFHKLKLNKSQELSNKEDYKIMHEINLIKIVLSEWKRVHPIMSIQNFEQQKPKNKRAHQFYRLELLYKCIKGLKQNRLKQQKQRCIADQKQKIKMKFKTLLEEQQQINYEQFL